MKRRKRFIRIRETLQSFDSLYSEINEYNTTFWSKILFSFWTVSVEFTVFILYVSLFARIDLVSKLIIIYGSLNIIIIFLIHYFHDFFSDLLCEQILQNIEFIDYIVF